jgi:endoglucanase
LLLALGFATSLRAESFMRVEGKGFIAPDGTKFQIKGINLSNWLMPEGYMFKFNVSDSPRQIFAAFDRLLGPERASVFWRQFRETYIGRDDIRFIKSVGFNTVRIPLLWRLFMDEQGEITGDSWQVLDRALGWMREEGLYAIIDLHAAPGGQTGMNHDDGPGYPRMFYVPRDRQLTIKLWQAIARRYAGNPVILGYDILNEPIAPYHDMATLNPRLAPFYKEVTAAIREIDPHRIIILGGGQWNQRFSMLGEPFTDNLAYTYHAFWASTKRDTIQRHLNFSNRYNVPMFLSESGEFTDEWNAAFRKLHEAHGLGWMFWAYKNLDTSSTVVSIPRPDNWDEIVAFVDGKRQERPDAAVIDRAMAQYLDGIRFKNAMVRGSYLESLGLEGAP